MTEFTAVEGVGRIVLFGGRQRVLRVEVKPDRLAAFSLSIGEVAEVLRAAQSDVLVGSFASGPLEMLKSLGAALVIVIAVIWISFGRLSATLIPTVAIPVALSSFVAPTIRLMLASLSDSFGRGGGLGITPTGPN